MTDETDTTDSSASGTANQSNPTASRRGTLAALAGLGVLGFGSGTGTASARYAQPAASTNLGEETIELNGETVFRLTGPQSFVREDDAEIRDGGTVRAGSLNEVEDGVVGGTIGGGGFFRNDTDLTEANVVTSHFGTVGGGAGNQAGTDGDDREEGQLAAVGGGFRNTANGSVSVVSGGTSNDAAGPRTVVAGGANNEATEPFSSVGGGVGNHATNSYATVTGGTGNVARGTSSTVVGGRVNIARSQHGTVVGGRGNFVDGRGSTVAGGVDNDATAEGAFVAGGNDNTADGEFSFAAGRRAETDSHNGAVVFGDSSTERIRADSDDSAYFQMPVTAQSFDNESSRANKQGFEPVNPDSVLDGVDSLDVSRWRYARNDDSTHMGPTAEEFHETFGLGDDTTISTVDADGVALAAIQALSNRLDERDDRIAELEEANERKEARIDDLESRLSALEEQL